MVPAAAGAPAGALHSGRHAGVPGGALVAPAWQAAEARPQPGQRARVPGKHAGASQHTVGCHGDWDPAQARGNPCHSMEVKTFKGGGHSMQEAGFRSKAATPLPMEKLESLVTALVKEADDLQVGVARTAPGKRRR